MCIRDRAAPFVCFIITAFRIAQRWFGEWKIVLKKDEKPLEEGSIASVIEEEMCIRDRICVPLSSIVFIFEAIRSSDCSLAYCFAV